jgi:hypothetical protein
MATKALDQFPGKMRSQVHGGVQLPLQGSRHPSGLLQLPRGALGSRTDEQPKREHVFYDPPAASLHEGQQLEEGQPHHDVQARSIRLFRTLSRRRGSTGIATTGCLRRITSSDGP